MGLRQGGHLARGNRFGTFGGVFTPSILTILGVIMYMRLPWIVGSAGLVYTVGIILIAHVISVTTGLSVSSIATDKSVQAGGPYYIISRSLGLPLGGTLGLALCVGLAFSISLYVIGFCESALPALGYDLNATNIRIGGSITLLALTLLTFWSTELAMKMQYGILVAIVVSLIAILFGTPPEPSTSAAMDPAPGAPSLALLFGIFFPAVTGFTAGVNMSGDLEDPRRAIPTGTLAAIAGGLITYLGLAFFLALRIPQDQLVNNPNVLLDMALHPHLVTAGVWGATLSSALGSILGSPRILQALSLDRVTPRFFAVGSGRTNEPRRALGVVFLIAWAGILVAELDVIARVVSMFFIATYGFLNLSAAIESWASPDFRPDFKIPRWVSLVGLATCVLIMIQLDIVAMFASVVLLTAIFLWLKRRELTLESGDTWSGVWSSIVRAGLHHLSSGAAHDRNWRPNILLFTHEETVDREILAGFGESIVSRRGVMTDIHLVPPGRRQHVAAVTDEQNPVGIFQRQIPCEDRGEAMEAVCRYHGFSGMEPNTVMLSWADLTADPAPAVRMLNVAHSLHMNALLVSHDETRKFGDHSRIDIWWRSDGGVLPKSLSLSRFVVSSDEWHRAKVRLLIVSDRTAHNDQLQRAGQRLLDQARIVASVKVFDNTQEPRPLDQWILSESAEADLIISSLPHDMAPSDPAVRKRIDSLAHKVGSLLLVAPSVSFETTQSTMESTLAVVNKAREPVWEVQEPLRAPALPELAGETQRFSKGHDALMEKLVERFVAPAYKQDAILLERTRSIVKKTFAQLEKASATDGVRRQKAVSRVQSSFLFQARTLLLEFGTTEVERQRLALEHGVEGFLTERQTLLQQLSPSLVVLRAAHEYARSPDDPIHLTRFKRRRRLVGWLNQEPPTYRVDAQALANWYLLGRGQETVYGVLKAFGLHSYHLIGEVGKLLIAVKTTIVQVSRRTGEASAGEDIATAERERLVERLNELLQFNGEFVRDHRAKLLGESRRMSQAFADDLSRMDVNRLLKRERRTPRSAAEITSHLPEVASRWVENRGHFLQRATLGLQIASLQNRLQTIATRLQSAVTESIQNGVLKDYERLFADLGAYRKGLDDEKRPPLKALADFRSIFDDQPVVDDLVREVQQAISELPESLPTLSDESLEHLQREQFDDVDVTPIPLRRLVHFLVESDLVGRLASALAEVPETEQRAMGVAQDVVRLITFHQREAESSGEVGETFRATMEPVVDNGLARIEVELERLRGAAPRVASELEQRLESVLDRTDAYAVTGKTSYIRSTEGQRVLSTVGKATSQMTTAARELLVTAQYRMSAGVLLARKLRQSPDHGDNFVEQTLALSVGNTPDPRVLEALPFYYRQLFLGGGSVNESFWVGRSEALSAASEAVARHRSGFPGALVFVGQMGSGNTALAQHAVEKLVTPAPIYTIAPPHGGSIDPDEFKARLEQAVGFSGEWDRIFQTLPEGSAIVITGLERWWQRSEDGLAVIRQIMDLIERYGDRCLFVLACGLHAFRLITRLVRLADTALAVIECRSLDAQRLRDIILLRHGSTGMQFALDGRTEADLTGLRVARLFNAHFEFSDGNVGTAMQAWISHIEQVQDSRLDIRMPVRPNVDVLDEMPIEWTALLLALTLHRQMSFARLQAVTQEEETVLRRHLNGLIRTGLATEDGRGVVGLNRYVSHLISAHLSERGLLQ